MSLVIEGIPSVPSTHTMEEEDTIESICKHLCEFNDDKNLCLEFRDYLANLNTLDSGKKIIEHLHNLITNPSTVHLKIERADGDFEENLSVSDIGTDGRVVISLPSKPEEGLINVPILVRTNDDSLYAIKDVSVPFFIGMGHELIHFIHKAEAFIQGSNAQDINNWTAHESHYCAIAEKCYGFSPQEEDSSGSIGFTNFLENAEGESYNTNFLTSWGGRKAYEEFRTIVGKETNILTQEEDQSFTRDTDISERHLLSNYFSCNPLSDDLTHADNPFITRWTHAFKAEDVSLETYTILNSVLTREDIDRLPKIRQQPS
ncbi:MAG: hypothetical protein LBD69_04220 [Puniceicoccales bacterium]|jgi:hypothetical protein|nr:hypothetical protein [Puniceicoccales bacterium]